jgi:hypothetical protein
MILIGKNRRTQRETCPSATLSTNNPTRTDPEANPGLRGEMPATNRPSHGMIYVFEFTAVAMGVLCTTILILLNLLIILTC